MKKIKLFVCFLFFTILFFSCETPGTSELRLTGKEESLPNELKGLKVYLVSTGEGGYVKVAVLNHKINSLTYADGDSEESTLLINSIENHKIKISKILFQNDSLIICKK